MPDKKIDLTIRSTNGTPWETSDFSTTQRVDHVREKAIQHFVDLQIMTAGDYALALVHGSNAEPLVDSNTLKESGVSEGAVLVLLVRGPQVDG